MQQATTVARQMVTRCGMSARLGPVTPAPRHDPYLPGSVAAEALGESTPHGETTATLVDAEVRRLLEECYSEAVRHLREHRHALDVLAGALLEQETLDAEAIRG
jgi:cell division protease FtsH